MRLGFCGVGRWASKIADQFRACGAELVAYDRKNVAWVTTDPALLLGREGPQIDRLRQVIPDVPGFGRYRPWRDQLEDPRIDAIIAMADPETTTAVALACAAAGKPCMATKPLMVTEMPELKAPLYVDLWRLWGDRWKRAKERLLEPKSKEIFIVLEGNGPVRSFPGALDYGPHAAAFAIDAFWNELTLANGVVDQTERGEIMRLFLSGPGRKQVEIRAGNGASSGYRVIGVRENIMSDWGDPIWDEPSNIDPAIKEAEIRAMCQSFLNDIHESNVSTYTLDLSIRGMRLLQQAREMAGAK